MNQHGAFRAASAMAFDAFLSFIPLLSLAGWTAHRLGYGAVLLRRLLESLPIANHEAEGADLFRMSDRTVLTLAPLSALLFMWVSSSGIATAMGVCEVMFEATKRVWWRRRVIAIGWVALALATLAIMASVFFGFTNAIDARLGRVVAAIAVSPLLVVLVIAFFRTAIRRPKGMRRHYWPGALLTVALWWTASIAFSIYVGRAVGYSLYYGSLATVAMVLGWLWLLSCALLVGGELNAHLEGVREFPPSTAFDGRR
jgi:membrane protein